MNSSPFIKFCLVVFGTIIILGLAASAIIYEDEIMRQLTLKTITIETNDSSKPLHLEENMTFIGSYETSIHFYGESGMYNRINIIHDDKRNVTCYLYDEGISCIPDCYIENKGGE